MEFDSRFCVQSVIIDKGGALVANFYHLFCPGGQSMVRLCSLF